MEVSLGEDDFCLFVTFLWVVWFARDVHIFQDKLFTELEVVAKACEHRHDYVVARRVEESRLPSRVDGGTRWRPQEVGWLKLNNDASYKRDFGASIVGVVRNDQGRPLWCYGEQCDCMDVEVAEALAIRRGLKYARDKDVRDLVVESDAQTMIFVLFLVKHDLSYLDNLVRDILEMAREFDRITFSWTGRGRRAGNMIAHKLAFLPFRIFLLFFFFFFLFFVYLTPLVFYSC